MNKKALLFGFDDLPAILAVGTAMKAFQAEVLPVARADYNKSLAVLAGLDTAPGPTRPYAGGTLGGRMIVLCGLDDQLDALLLALSKAGAGADCLKAVLTVHNRSWNAVMLFEELRRERRAIQGK